MRRRRIIVLDEMMESCRLLPTYLQSIIFGIMLGIATLIIPVITYFFFYTIILIQSIFIMLLIQKFIVYKNISNIESAIQRKVLWIETKEDYKDLLKKMLVNSALILFAVFLHLKVSNTNVLIVNGIFCLLFFLKICFFVPPLSIRIFDDKGMTFQIINEKEEDSIQIGTYVIKRINIEENSIIISVYDKSPIKYEVNFKSNLERIRTIRFLSNLKELEYKVFDSLRQH